MNLGVLKRQGFFQIWHDREISAGTEWAREIDKHLNTAQIILLFVRQYFMLSSYLETLLKEHMSLFPSEKTQEALTERALGHLISKYAKQGRLVDVSPYDLRHRFGYRMAEVVPLHRLAQIMGHDSLNTTMVYIWGTKQDLQQDVEKIAWT